MASFQTPLCPFTIEFAPDKLDEIRIAVVDGFYAVPRGGVEIGGVLFGKTENGRLLIRDFRKIETEYLTGPSFRLSKADLAGLRTLLAETTFDDPEVRPVGWYLSRTRKGIHLSESDLDLCQEFFPDPSQVVLVLRPSNLGTVRGGYFFRQVGGTLVSDGAANEFTLEPYFGEKRASEAEIAREEVPSALNVEAPAIVEELPENDCPVIVEEPLLFQSISQNRSWSVQQGGFVLLLAAGSAVACVAGYWLATH